MRLRWRSTSISVAFFQYLSGRDAGLRRSLPFSYLFQPGIYRGASGQALEFRPQVLLHGLSLQRRACGERIADFLWNIANSDLNGHACIMQAFYAVCIG